MLGYSMSYDKMVGGVSMLGCKIPTEINKCLIVLDVEHDAGVEQISHRLQVCKLSNHFMKLNFLFRSQWSPTML